MGVHTKRDRRKFSGTSTFKINVNGAMTQNSISGRANEAPRIKLENIEYCHKYSTFQAALCRDIQSGTSLT